MRSFIQTLTMVDVATGWTECLPLVTREGSLVVEAINRAQSLFPWLLRGVDFDNDSAFMNDVVVPWCRKQKLEVTRSRAYKKNDQAFVEQKNGAVVRGLMGYGRFDGVETARVEARLMFQEKGVLVYMGKVGTGWSRTVSSGIRKQLDTVVSPKSKLTKPIRASKATWVEPAFVAEVEYRDLHQRRAAAGIVIQRSVEGMNPACPVCNGVGWVCENHPDKPWDADLGCVCGAGVPCKCNETGGVDDPDAR